MLWRFVFVFFFILGAIDPSWAIEPEKSLEERLTDLELQSLSHRIQTNLEMNVLGGYFQNEHHRNQDATVRNVHFKNNIRLKFKGDLNPSFRTYVSFQVNYLFNDDLQTSENITDERTTSVFGSRPYLRTGYFDWNLLGDNLIFSAGRLPTVYGPPEHLRMGRDRQGTYPSMGYNVPLDGLALTYCLVPLLHNWGAHFTGRTVYMPGSIANRQDPHEAAPLSERDPRSFSDGHEGFTQMFEYEVARPTSYFDRFLAIWQLSYLRLGAFKERKGVSKGVNYSVYLDGGTLARMYNTAFHLELHRIFKTRFDFYGSYMHSWTKPSGTMMTSYPDFTGLPDEEYGQFISDGDTQGNRYLLGTRFHFKKSHLGLEYWASSRYPIPNDLYSDDLVALGQFFGKIGHIYYNYEFFKNQMRLKLGYFYIHEEKDFSDGFVNNSRQRIQSVYTGISFEI